MPAPSNGHHKAPTLNGRILNAHADIPDLRDRTYSPSLINLAVTMDPPDADYSPVLDQGQEGACTGFALASVINLLNNRRRFRTSFPLPRHVSPRMLYEMARRHDEWPGEDYGGSSLRGALKGFFNYGVCNEDLAPYVVGESGWELAKDQAKDARNTGLGAYYRLKAQLIDYHAALNEVGAIYASAYVHRGWRDPENGIIEQSNVHEGGHAFMIVGYDQTGFLIQNSWGPDWGGFKGHPGVAHWSYADWAQNVYDAWVLRLAVPTPEDFNLTQKYWSGADLTSDLEISDAPRASEILGHYIHLDDGRLVGDGRYPSSLATLRETGRILEADGNSASPKYQHLLIYSHGGLNNSRASAKRIQKMRTVFKRNGIYPIHFMWETGFFEELGDILANPFRRTEARMGFGFDFSDWLLEKACRIPGRAIWNEMKSGARKAFIGKGGGRQAIELLLDANSRRKVPMKVHLVGHSAGSIMHARLLDALAAINPAKAGVETCSLMAPACTLDLFEKSYRPRLKTPKAKDGIKQLVQYNLIDKREQDDAVGPYRKSLLYFVSNAFEKDIGTELLGMEIHTSDLKLEKAHTLHYAGRSRKTSDAHTHGGFDNDRATMNDILKTVLGKSPQKEKAFQPKDLEGY